MNHLMDKRFYKVISLFIKAILLAASFYYIVQKIITAGGLASFDRIVLSATNTGYLLTICILMFLNWGLEARKWQVLIAPYEKISLLRSLQSILTGITVGLFTPNRVGEFTGRIFFLETADRFQASVKSIFGSFIQLSVTLIAGIIAIWEYHKKHYDEIAPLTGIVDPQKKYMLLLIIAITVIGFLAIFRMSFFAKYKHYLSAFLEIKKAELLHVSALAVFRYLVFTVQYYLILMVLGIEIEFSIACILIALTFFIISIIPTFALTEIIVRSAVAVYVFSVLAPSQPVLVASASFLLWLINLAIPALIGSFFLGKFQLFKAY
jgi:hypothetical protein